jgi:hypothetical protein
MSKALSPDGIAVALKRSAQLLLLCHFNEALSILTQFGELHEMLPIDAVTLVRARALIFLSRGYPRLAQDALLLFTETSRAHLDAATSLGFSIHTAYVKIVGCGEAIEDESILVRAQNYLDERDLSDYTSFEVSRATAV